VSIIADLVDTLKFEGLGDIVVEPASASAGGPGGVARRVAGFQTGGAGLDNVSITRREVALTERAEVLGRTFERGHVVPERFRRPELGRYGTLLVLPGGIAGGKWHLPQDPPLAPSVRGKVSGFSLKSRKRLMCKLAAVDWSAYAADGKRSDLGRGLFVTLTYPGDYPNNRGRIKRDLECFHHRLKRAFPGFSSAVWKVELQKRGAAHFHVVIFFDESISARVFRSWARRAWFQVVGSGDRRHLRRGVDARAIYGQGQRLLAYLSKYLGKIVVADDLGGADLGRIWGVWGKLPVRVIGSVIVHTRGAWVELMRRLRRWGRGSRYMESLTVNWSGFLAFGRGDWMLDLFRGLDCTITISG